MSLLGPREEDASSVGSDIDFLTDTENDSSQEKCKDWTPKFSAGKLEFRCRSKRVDYTVFFLSDTEDGGDDSSLEPNSCCDSESEGSLYSFVDSEDDPYIFSDGCEDYASDLVSSDNDASDLDSYGDGASELDSCSDDAFSVGSDAYYLTDTEE
jgi:hypothetical protein